MWFGRRNGGAAASRANSHLTGRDELQRAEGDLEVGSVGLEFVQSAGDALLELRGVLAARAVGRDLVEGRRAHVGGCRGYRWMIDLRGDFEKSKTAGIVEWNWEGFLGFASPQVFGGSY